MDKKLYPRIGEEVIWETLDNGLPVCIVPKQGFSRKYALFATRYGGMDMRFELKGQWLDTPAGIAHYLEHKMFDTKDGNALQELAKNGAEPNAFTSNAITCYYFDSTEKFYENLEILLSFVSVPYFTDESVEKEQGIIGQEIKMYDDDPQWRMMFSLLRAMYHAHPIKDDIAGTVESIAEITPEYLYRCYNTFYNLNNMALCVCGNCTEEEVLTLCDKMLKKSEPVEVERVFEEEPDTIVQPLVEEKLPVACPMFQFGVKEAVTGAHRTEKDLAATEIMASDSSPMFRKLLDAGLVNEASFSYEYFEGTGYGALLFGGESGNPEAVCDAIREEMARLKREGVREEDVRRSAKSLYGANVSGLNSPDVIANAVMTMHFNDRELFRYIECFSEITAEDVNARIQTLFDMDKTAASIIRPLDEA